MQRKIRALVALSVQDERDLVTRALADDGMVSKFATDIKSVESLMGDIDVIITDTSFAAGAFADWLSLWPVPAILAADPSAEPSRLAKLTLDESSCFTLRDPAGDWIRYVPYLVRKALAVRESLDRQNTNVIRAESSYMNLLRVVPDIVYVLDGDGCFVYLNDAVSQLGWKPSELLGRHFAEIVHPDDLPEVGRSLVLRRYEGVVTGPGSSPKLFDERRTGSRMTRGLDVRLRHKDAVEWTTTNIDAWGEVSSMGVSLPEFQGMAPGTMGIIHDVSERRELEKRLARELDARDILLKEIHHRVKNNLQVVSSLLNLESDYVEDEHAKSVFLDCQTQIQSMSLVHEQIYRGSALEGVEATAYFARLAEYLSSVHDARARGVALQVNAGNIVLTLDSAIPLSIIITELVSNAFKHAFPDGRRGNLLIGLEESDGSYELVVRDDGVGRAAAAARDQSGRRKGIGMDLVTALAGQLGGELELTDDGGAGVVIRFPSKA